MSHPELASGEACDPTIWAELRLARFCEELDKASREDLLTMAKTLARACIVTHPEAIRLMIRETIHCAPQRYNDLIETMQPNGVAMATENPSY